MLDLDHSSIVRYYEKLAKVEVTRRPASGQQNHEN
jgi:hypothetical protein